ncbi:hypothetical protein ZIOFF_012210 [Zingiber officinale]|uniref:EIF3j n=1 Tax=Zingiber officinale TaxID=94328 RepID=A0A8J5HLE1_ZINOF|nr:hypothetical protein ZIOFF_012210 [Zingiber officinale]
MAKAALDFHCSQVAPPPAPIPFSLSLSSPHRHSRFRLCAADCIAVPRLGLRSVPKYRRLIDRAAPASPYATKPSEDGSCYFFRTASKSRELLIGSLIGRYDPLRTSGAWILRLDQEEDFDPAPPSLLINKPKNQWDDEDVDDENVKESWDDEEEPVQELLENEGILSIVTLVPPFIAWKRNVQILLSLFISLSRSLSHPWNAFSAGHVFLQQETKPQQEVEVTATKTGGKGATKKDKQPEAKKVEITNDVLADPVAEKLRQQRLVEEADYKSTAELFAKKGDERSLDNFIPKSENDFLEYAELLSHKIRPYEKSFHYLGLLKDVIRLSMTSLKAADAKEISSSITAIANEKLKAEKEANAGKKKQGAKKKQLHIGRAEDDYDTTGGYDNADDYDFM